MCASIYEWCKQAQDDQRNGKSAIYAGYRHGRSGAPQLIPDQVKNLFAKAIRHEPKPAAAKGDYPISSKWIDQAQNNITGRKEDFRVNGERVVSSGLLVNISYMAKSPDSPTSTAGGGISSVHSPSSVRPSISNKKKPIEQIVWLTEADALIKKLEQKVAKIGHRKLENLHDIFSLMIRLLGLKARSQDEHIAKLNLYTLKNGGTLWRPHALSKGYPDRFCSVSSFGNGWGQRETTPVPQKPCLKRLHGWETSRKSSRPAQPTEHLSRSSRNCVPTPLDFLSGMIILEQGTSIHRGRFMPMTWTRLILLMG